jgi:hypothetical protein
MPLGISYLNKIYSVNVKQCVNGKVASILIELLSVWQGCTIGYLQYIRARIRIMLFFSFLITTFCRRRSSEGVHQGGQTQSEPGSQLSRTRQVFTFLINNVKESKLD